MGLTTEYLRFVPGPVFGIIGNSSGNVLLLKTRGQVSSNLFAVGACENVFVWNYRSRAKEFELRGDKHAVTTITQSARTTRLAAGYADGAIRIFNIDTRSCEVTFNGHRAPISCIAYDESGFLLASGGMDSHIIVWDMNSEAGLCRLKGHTAPITQCQFLNKKNVLISCSKDSLVKFWAIDLKHCFRTLVIDSNEIWDLLVVKSSMFVANKENGIYVYKLNSSSDDDNELMPTPLKRQRTDKEDDASCSSAMENYIKVDNYGQIDVQVSKKRLSFAVDPNERLFGYHTYRKILNLFKILNPEEVEKEIQKKKKKAKKALKAEGQNVEVSEIEIPVTVDHELTALKPLKFPDNIVSFACEVEKDVAKLVVLFHNNSISLYTLDIGNKNADATLLYSISHCGHRNIIRTLGCSSDGLRLLSGGDDCVKIWNLNSQNCSQSLECEAALCSMFTAGDKHCIIGSKLGKINIFDIDACLLLESIEAHDGPVQCLCQYPDQRGLVTGGKDKDVKFWNLELIKDENYSHVRKRLSLSLQRTLKMPEEVLCIKYSPNYKMLAISLMDCSIKVLYADTLKLAFLLYGHKLPVRSMDISHDSALIVTGSDDRNVKIWSMDFGSCNKSLFAHDDSVTCVQFVPKSHLFFTAGKDKRVKQWDADKFHKIIVLEGHQGDVEALIVSPDGKTLVSAARDKSIRIWENSEELLILEEEQELEREAETYKAMAEEESPAIPGEFNLEVSLPNRKTPEVIKAADQLIEALDIYKEEMFKLSEYEKQGKSSEKSMTSITHHPLYVASSPMNPKHFMLLMLRRIQNKDIQQTLLLLPFDYVIVLLEILFDHTELWWEPERSIKSIAFLIKIHWNQLSVMPQHSLLLERLSIITYKRCCELKDRFGFNLVGVKNIAEMLYEEKNPVFVDLTQNKSRKKKKQKCLPILKSV